MPLNSFITDNEYRKKKINNLNVKKKKIDIFNNRIFILRKQENISGL